MRGLIVFDCDGTLVDSQHTIVESMVAAFHANDWPAPDAERVRGVVGLSLDEAIAILAPQCPTERRVAIRAAYKSAFAELRSRGDHEEVTYPGVVEVLDTLSAEEYTLGIATGKSTHGLRATLTRLHLLDRFATLQTADTAPSKPHPTMLRQAMAETCATPETTALIGDTTFDMNMAAQCRYIGDRRHLGLPSCGRLAPGRRPCPCRVRRRSSSSRTRVAPPFWE